MLQPKPLFIFAALALTTGCGSDSLSQSWQLDRLRILAVRAEATVAPTVLFDQVDYTSQPLDSTGPAEPQPGQTVSFQSLQFVPQGLEIETLWLACLPEEADDFGCDVSSDDAFIGYEPYFAPSWTPGADVLDEMSEQEQTEGLSAFIQLIALPAGSLEETDTGSSDLSDLEDSDEVEIAYKRMPVSLSPTPNHNPDLDAVTVDSVEIGTGDSLQATRAQTYELDVMLAADAVETYSYTTSEGSIEEREEEPYLSWFVSCDADTLAAGDGCTTGTMWSTNSLH
ncbi:MAG: hypothetical protein QGG40_19490, partial [Myxococcota bacterium]|nr:hypothetical protein [Myxococcota bacterium]